MKEKEFLYLCKETLKLKSFKEAKEREALFWAVIKKALEKDKRVVFKDWGVFEMKDVKSRKVIVPTLDGEFYTEPKKVIKFLCGKGLRERVNEDD